MLSVNEICKLKVMTNCTIGYYRLLKLDRNYNKLLREIYFADKIVPFNKVSPYLIINLPVLLPVTNFP